MTRIVQALVLMSVLMLAACGTTGPGSVTGLRSVLPGPVCIVKATTRTGQQWVSGTLERGVETLGWERPRRLCVDARSRVAQAAVKEAPPRPSTSLPFPEAPPPPLAAPATMSPAKRALWRRLIGRE